MKYEIDIFHYLDIYKKESRKIAFLIGLAMIITAIASNLMPVTYRSTAIILSPKEGGQMGALGAYLGMSSLAAGNSSDEVVFSMLKSRRMSNDIYKYFDLKNKRKSWWALDTYAVTGGFAIEVKAHDPDLSEKIVTFAIANLDKINVELQVTSHKPMIKVLDSAVRGTPIGRDTTKKVLVSGLFVFLLYTLVVFFKEYFSKIKQKDYDKT